VPRFALPAAAWTTYGGSIRTDGPEVALFSVSRDELNSAQVAQIVGAISTSGSGGRGIAHPVAQGTRNRTPGNCPLFDDADALFGCRIEVKDS